MPTYKFTDAQPKTMELWPIGDYRWQVVKCEFGIMNGGNCNGADCMELAFDFQRTGPGGGIEHKDVTKKLIFHEKTAWVVDSFVKSGNLLIDGAPPAKDQDIDFKEHMVVGLQGWATLGHREYKSDRDGKMKKVNEIVAFLTNKEKLPKIVAIPADAHADADDFDRA